MKLVALGSRWPMLARVWGQAGQGVGNAVALGYKQLPSLQPWQPMQRDEGQVQRRDG